MALDIEILNSVTDVAQVADAASGKFEPWVNSLVGMAVVMTALIMIWVVTSIVGSYFIKAKKSSPGKPKAAAAPAAASAAAPAANDIPLAVIIAAAVQMVGGPIRNVTVNAPGMESVAWSGNGRSAIFSSHAAKAPASVSALGGGVRK